MLKENFAVRVKYLGFSGCANNSNCPGFDSVCDPLDHSNCSFCDNNNCTGGEYPINNNNNNNNNNKNNNNNNKNNNNNNNN